MHNTPMAAAFTALVVVSIGSASFGAEDGSVGARRFDDEAAEEQNPRERGGVLFYAGLDGQRNAQAAWDQSMLR
jgi:hypothetical protein